MCYSVITNNFNVSPLRIFAVSVSILIITYRAVKNWLVNYISLMADVCFMMKAKINDKETVNFKALSIISLKLVLGKLYIDGNE